MIKITILVMILLRMSVFTVAQEEEPIVIIGAGDIALCELDGDDQTAAILDTVDYDIVYTVGDQAYPRGTAETYADCYDPTWGRHKAATRPTIGNHDYAASFAWPYYDYFGDELVDASERRLGFYSYNEGDWHFIALNSNLWGYDWEDQKEWLAADLAENATDCMIAYYHHPLYSSGYHGADERMGELWEILYEYGTDVILNGHDHHYERFAPQNPSGELDEENGIRQFIIGTGGGYLRAVGEPIENSETLIADTWGVLRLDLYSDYYDWEFIPTEGDLNDSGTWECSK